MAAKRAVSAQRAARTRANARRAAGSSAAGAELAQRYRLDSSELRWNCESIPPAKRRSRPSQLLGQERPVRALRTGLELYAPGFNIFVSGLLGSGRLRIVHNLLEELKPQCRLGPDRVFVHNFAEPTQPRLINLPRGRAVPFREDLLDLGRAIRDALRQSLQSRWHRASRKLVIGGAEERRQRLLDAVEREAERAGCALVQYRDGNGEMSADILPVFDGEVRPLEQFAELLRNRLIQRGAYEALLEQRTELIERLEQATERTRRVYRELARELRDVDRGMAERCVSGLLGEFAERWPEEGVGAQLDALREHVVKSLELWMSDEAGEQEDGEHDAPDRVDTVGLTVHQASVLGAHIVRGVGAGGGAPAATDCPVIVESNPNYQNLFGTIEPAPDGSYEPSGLGRIHPGALLRADGGYLILRAADLMSEPGAWRHLQRALRSGRLEVREFDPHSGATIGALQPESIPIDVKVVMIGEPGLYEHLREIEPAFMQLFKVHAEFDSTVANNVANRRRYAELLGWIAAEEALGTFAPQAIAAVVEFGARSSGRRTRLSTCFGDLADIAREAAHLSLRHGRTDNTIAREHVEAALHARIDRSELAREQTDRDFEQGYVLLDTTGKRVGAVQALTVLEAQGHSFGKPVRVTATVSRALRDRDGVLSIEREAEMTGPLHDKGVLILEGFFQGRFGRDRLVSFRANVCFEQLYNGLDGDSATCAELVALMSALTQTPVRQDLAITGSLNQLGDVQAVGGTNEKIEGFYARCKQRRLSGSQGVIIPRVNVEDLMLLPEIVEAASEGRFHIHAIEGIDDAFELLFGLQRDEIEARVVAALDALSPRV